MNDVRHTVEQVDECIVYLIDKHTVERYDADGQKICRWIRWDDYQNIKWHDDAKYPDKDGTYEVSNNPKTIAKRVDKRSVVRVVKRVDEHHVKHTVPQSEKEKEKEEEKERPPKKGDAKSGGGEKKGVGHPAVQKYIDLMRELLDPTYKPGPVDPRGCKEAYDHLDGDMEEFERRARNCMGDDWFKKNMPNARYFANNIEKYKYKQGKRDIEEDEVYEDVGGKF